MLSPRFLASILAILVLSNSAHALIMVGRGNQPVHDQNWRAGAIDVANLKSRVGWWEGPPFGGGEWHFQYRGDADAFNEALSVFAKVRAPVLELVVADGPQTCDFLRDERDPKSDTRVDWEFVTWNPQSYYHLFWNPKSTFDADHPNFRKPLPPPRITVYIGGGGLVQWDKITVPKNIRFIDQRASAAAKSVNGPTVVANIYDMATGKPIPDAKLDLGKFNAQNSYDTVLTGNANEDGVAKLEKIPAGTYRISVSAEGYAPVVVGYEKLNAQSYREFNDIELSRLATITGQIVDDAGKPVAGATVRADDIMGINGLGYPLLNSAQATSDAQGRFELASLPTGYARLFCHAKNYFVPIGQIIQTPAKDLAITAQTTGTVKGKVLDRDGKVPTGGVIVECNPEGDPIGKWGGSMNVSPDGTFQFNGVPPAKYNMAARRNPGRVGEEARTTITVSAAKTAEVELKLP